MTKNKFEKLYTKIQELKKLYNEGEKEKARAAYTKLEETIKTEEKYFQKIWAMYKNSQDNKNQYTNLKYQIIILNI